ncbi:MAG: hypothetical protein ABI747_03980 [Candidatus Moraniibacteriota bacterium]
MLTLRGFVAIGAGLALVGCANIQQKAGFDPRHDTQVASAKAVAPQGFDPEELTVQDVRDRITLETNPAQADGYIVYTVKLGGTVPLSLAREVLDPRQPYPKFSLANFERNGDHLNMTLKCREGKPECSDVRDLKMDPSMLEARKWRAALRDAKTQELVALYPAVYRRKGNQFRVLFPPASASVLVGKTLHLWSAYGDFVILVDGTLVPRPARDVANLPREFYVEFPSVIRFDQLVTMDRSSPEGKFFLEALAQEFPLPAPFQKGSVVHLDYYLGAMKLTPKTNGLDCVISSDIRLVLSSDPLGSALSLVYAAGESLRVASMRDCGR